VSRIIDAVKWLASALWITVLSVAIASAILAVGAATLGDLLLRFFRRQ
jgi:hypothetical protein